MIWEKIINEVLTVNNKWKSIWDKKKAENINLNRDEFEIFCDLKKADGFDVNVHDEQAYFKAFYRDWEKMYKKLIDITGGDINSIYEVGCGSGVNLFLFHNRIENAVLGGIDYSEGLIALAKSILPCADLLCGNAEVMNTDIKYDFVMADSVFQYFGSRDYAETILNKMICKSNKAVYISEIHDITLRAECLECRRNAMDNYDQIYEGLDKMFYSKDWLSEIAEKHNKKTIFTNSENPEYWNSKYVFNCFII